MLNSPVKKHIKRKPSAHAGARSRQRGHDIVEAYVSMATGETPMNKTIIRQQAVAAAVGFEDDGCWPAPSNVRGSGLRVTYKGYKYSFSWRKLRLAYYWAGNSAAREKVIHVRISHWPSA
jgi:hypothetical protein